MSKFVNKASILSTEKRRDPTKYYVSKFGRLFDMSIDCTEETEILNSNFQSAVCNHKVNTLSLSGH